MCVCVCVHFLSVSSETLGGVVSVYFSKLLFCGVYGEKSLEPSRGSCLRGC